MIWNRVLIKVLVGILLSCAIAPASTIILPTGVDWTRGGSVWIQEDGNNINAYFAGVIFIKLTDGATDFYRDTLCVDLFTDILLGKSYASEVLRPDQVPGKNLGRVSWLVDNALLPTQESGYVSQLPQSAWVTTVQQGTGMQLAIWDIVHDGGDGFGAGRVRAVADPAHPTDPQVLTWANYYRQVSLGRSDDLAFIYNNVDLGTGLPAQMLSGPRFRDSGPSPIPNPEPSTTLLSGCALAAVWWMLRKRRSQV